MSRRQWVILLVLQIAELVSIAGIVAVLAGMHAWQGMFGNDAGIGWIFSSYLLVSAVGSAVFGRLGDMFGRRRAILAVLALSILGSTIGMMSQNLWIIVAARTIQGASGAILSLVLGLMREHIPADKVPFGVSLTYAVASGSSALVLILAGSLTDHFGPRSIFALQAGLSVAAFAAILAICPPDGKSTVNKRLDWLGGLLFSLGVAGQLYFIMLLGDREPVGSFALIVEIASLLMLIGCYFHERRCPHPLIDVRQLSTPPVLAANLGYLAISASLMQGLLVLAPLLQQSPETGIGFGLSATYMGIAKFPPLVVGMIASILAGVIIARSGTKVAIRIGCLVGAAACLIPIALSHSMPAVLCGFALINFGVSACAVAFSTTIVSITPASRTSEATGLMAVFRAGGQAIGAQGVNSLLAISSVAGADGHFYPAPGSYIWALTCMAVLSALTLLLILKLPAAIAIRATQHARP